MNFDSGDHIQCILALQHVPALRPEELVVSFASFVKSRLLDNVAKT